jgi:hypothetical protein
MEKVKRPDVQRATGQVDSRRSACFNSQVYVLPFCQSGLRIRHDSIRANTRKRTLPIKDAKSQEVLERFLLGFPGHELSAEPNSRLPRASRPRRWNKAPTPGRLTRAPTCCRIFLHQRRRV